MTSKEALKELKENAQEICEWEVYRLNIIEKDLEALKILINRSLFIYAEYKRIREELDNE